MHDTQGLQAETTLLNMNSEPKMPDASLLQRVDAVQAVLEERGLQPAEFIDQANHL